MKKRIRTKDDPSLVWDDEKKARRFIATPLIAGDIKDRPDDMKAYYKELMKMPIENLVNHKDTAGSYEFVEDDEEVEPNNYTTKTLYVGDQNPYADIEDIIDEWDKEEDEKETEEPDELDAYTKDLEDYLEKNPKAKDKNYY